MFQVSLPSVIFSGGFPGNLLICGSKGVLTLVIIKCCTWYTFYEPYFSWHLLIASLATVFNYTMVGTCIKYTFGQLKFVHLVPVLAYSGAYLKTSAPSSTCRAPNTSTSNMANEGDNLASNVSDSFEMNGDSNANGPDMANPVAIPGWGFPAEELYRLALRFYRGRRCGPV